LVSVTSFRKFVQTECCSLTPSIQHHASTSKRRGRIKNINAENNKTEEKQETGQLRGVGDISTIENLLKKSSANNVTCITLDHFLKL
jgi:hypothetical protein